MSETFAEDPVDAVESDAHPGVDDGSVDAAGERIVHEFDGERNLIGWHKEPAEGTED